MEFEDAGFGFVSCKKQGYVMCRINHKEQGEDHVAVFDKGQFHNVVLSQSELIDIATKICEMDNAH